MSFVLDVSGLVEYLKGLTGREEPYQVLKSVQARMMALNQDYQPGGAVSIISTIRPDLADQYTQESARINNLRNRRIASDIQ